SPPFTKLTLTSEPHSRFYGAPNRVLGFEYLHSLDLIYRDLRPENLLLDAVGYIKVTDFGFAKRVKGRTWTLATTRPWDWWALGVLVYEMRCRLSAAFFADQPNPDLREDRLGKPFLLGSEGPAAQPALQCDLTKRFGNLKNGVSDIKCAQVVRHPPIGIQVYKKEVEAPFVPKIQGPGRSVELRRIRRGAAGELPAQRSAPRSSPNSDHPA
uniref:Protein kinase domain-containing protein n=1 Tax=Macrostomum lignano TaxID=282301 RepID=A0A1I8FQK9_9PLAT